MLQRLLRWRGWALVLGLALALSLAVPAQATEREGNPGWRLASILGAWWNQLWPGPVDTVAGADPMSESDRNSGIDPNGLKSQPTGSSHRTSRPSHPPSGPSN